MARNLIIICPDEMRGDCAGYAGNPVIRTPSIDALAERGVVFENHFAVMPKCVPSRIGLMTGRYTHAGGYRTVSRGMNPGEDDLLARFTAAGYRTALFGKDHCWGAERVKRDFEFTSHAGPPANHMEGVPPLSDHRPERGGAIELDLEAIETEDLWDDAIVLFWSDHGDYAGQYGPAE